MCTTGTSLVVPQRPTLASAQCFVTTSMGIHLHDHHHYRLLLLLLLSFALF
jgi:hypothetical protein